MSSKRKITSARANGAKSKGPITEEGRKTSSMNALTHGLTARTIVFSNENQDEYNALRDSYMQDLLPTSPVEKDLVMDMVNAKWQQRRLMNTETELFERQMYDQKEELDEAFEQYGEILEHALAFRALSETVSLQTLNRTASRLERTYYRALNNFLRLRQVRESNMQKVEKRTESQDRTPAANRQSPPDPQPSHESTSPENSTPPAEPLEKPPDGQVQTSSALSPSSQLPTAGILK